MTPTDNYGKPANLWALRNNPYPTPSHLHSASCFSLLLHLPNAFFRLTAGEHRTLVPTTLVTHTSGCALCTGRPESRPNRNTGNPAYAGFLPSENRWPLSEDSK